MNFTGDSKKLLYIRVRTKQVLLYFLKKIVSFCGVNPKVRGERYTSTLANLEFILVLKILISMYGQLYHTALKIKYAN